MVEEGRLEAFKKEISELNCQDYIVGSENAREIRKIAILRNRYLAHWNRFPDRFINDQSKRLFEISESLIKNIRDSAPIVILPIAYGMNEWGARYITYIDESDVGADGYIPHDSPLLEEGCICPERCKRFYLFNQPSDFRPFEPALCLHPARHSVMVDPTLFYLSELERPDERQTEIM